VVPQDLAGWPQVARLLLSAAAALLVVAVVARAWRSPRLRRLAALAGLLFIFEMALGGLILVAGATPWLLVPYVPVAAALWGSLVALAALARLEITAGAPELPPAGNPAGPQPAAGPAR
jgi:heme A synthase